MKTERYDLGIMATIMQEKDKEIDRQSPIPQNAEGRRLGEAKRFTFDVPATPVDPLR